LLPLLALRGVRKQLRRTGVLTLLALLSFGAISLGLTGCGGYVGTSPKTYVVTVTATSGQLQQSTTVTLTVE
jgi:ABC-type transporter Mla subunit MlaD